MGWIIHSFPVYGHKILKTLFLPLIIVLFGVSNAAWTQVITVTNTNDSGAGSLRQAVNSAVNGDEIRFDPNLISLGSDSIVLDSSLVFNTNLTISGLYNGNDTLYISGGFNDRIITVDNALSLRLDSLILIHGNVTGNGGCISFTNSDSLLITNSIIQGSTATNNGGGIYMYSLTYTVPSSTYLHMSNSQIRMNTSGGSGGGMYYESRGANDPAYAWLDIDSCEVYQNSTFSNGGGIFLLTNSAPFTPSYATFLLQNSTVNTNTSSRGAGIYTGSTSEFSSPSINTTSDAKSICYINNSTVTYNTSSSRGGGIYTGSESQSGANASTIIDSAILILNNSLIHGNVGTRGGGIYSYSPSSNVRVYNSTLSANIGSEGGGAIFSRPNPFPGTGYSSVSNVLIDNSVIRNNQATTRAGGGIASSTTTIPWSTGFTDDNTTSNVSILNSTLRGNSSDHNGGGVYSFARFSNVDIFNSTISENTSLSHGGGIYSATNASSTTSTVNIDASTINGNSSYFYGAGVYSISALSTVNATHSTFTGNTAGSFGGGIHCGYNATSAGYGAHVNPTNCTITGNSSTTSGGGVYSARTINPAGSIIALNGADNVYFETVFGSLGYNIFSDAAIVGSAATDQMGATALQLNLDTLDLNGGTTKTMMPMIPSIAIDNGNPTDLSDAQNVPIVATREVGAAEVCYTTYVTDFQSSCDSLVWIDGITYYSDNNTAVDTLVNGAGCAMVVSLNYNMTSDFVTDIVSTCDSLTWIDGITYYASNPTAVDTLVNLLGCDSIVTLNLTVLSDNVVDTQIACDSLTWIDGNTYTSNTNTPTWILTNTAGCDSLISLDLTINNSFTGIDVQVACDSFTWIDGNTYTSTINTPTWTMTNALGCDSILTLDLTVNYPNGSTDVQTVCDSLVWLDGITYTTSTNSPIWILSNVAGCDSIVTLDLTVNYSNTGTDVQVACDSFTWMDGNTYTVSTNSPTWTVTNSTGCDSLVTLDLTVNSVNAAITQLDDLTIQANTSAALYQWLNCDSSYTEIIGETGQTYIAAQNGNYAVQITENGCTDTSACVAITNVGIIENDFGDHLLLYPNPTNGNFSVDLGSNYETVTITIMDINGKLIQSKTYYDSQLLNLKLKEPVGAYLLVIESGDKKAVIQLLKE